MHGSEHTAAAYTTGKQQNTANISYFTYTIKYDTLNSPSYSMCNNSM